MYVCKHVGMYLQSYVCMRVHGSVHIVMLACAHKDMHGLVFHVFEVLISEVYVCVCMHAAVIKMIWSLEEGYTHINEPPHRNPYNELMYTCVHVGMCVLVYV